MVRFRHVWAALLLTAAGACSAFAQPAAGSTPVAYPRWDAGGSWGLIFSNVRDLKAFDEPDPAANALNVDVGRYLTPHLKVDAGVMWSPSHFADLRIVPTEGLPPELYYLQFTPVDVRPTSVSAALTYQFRENEFMHPYVSAGVRAIHQSFHAHRDPFSLTIRGVRYAIPGVDERDSSVIARPFVAAGCKSYFNQRVFMRSEWLIALGPAGFSHSTLRIGAGVDF